MITKTIFIYLLITASFFLNKSVAAQDTPVKNDTFFLAKKKGLLGRFGKSISTTPPPDEAPAKIENPFLKYKGKIIHSVEIVVLGFQYDIDDTSRKKNNFGVRLAETFHKNTSDKVIRNGLFFKEGDPLFPYLLADNERYLRELPYTKDARILVEYAIGDTGMVDVVVLSKDVFSIGGKINISSKNRGRAELREENFLGTGNRVLISGFHENPRSPQTGVGGELVKRNIHGSFLDYTIGYRDYGTAFSSGRNQETLFYTRLEKPLVTPYIPSTGALEWTYQRTRNVYNIDSIYNSDIKYESFNLDGWYGHTLDSKRALYDNKEIRVHRFLAVRGFKQYYRTLPTIYIKKYDPRFADFTGFLASFNVFRQVFYKTTFLYGFGRNEDIPEGFSASATAGYVNKQYVKRPYAGVDLSLANLQNRGMYYNYTFRMGGYFLKNHFEDVDLVFNISRISRLRKIAKSWYHRAFIVGGISTQINPVLNTPLVLNSEFGLPYFNNGELTSDLRATIKYETVFYNTAKILGFGVAPFIFTDAILVKPSKLDLNQSDIFTAVGGGLRTRNENLVFGTVELRGYYFPRINGDMKAWKVELNSDISFKFISNFIRRPSLIISN